MAIHKLMDGPITMTVASIESTEGKFGPQWKFSSDAGVDVYVNELPASKQLARLNHTTESIVGQTIHMEQVKKNGTTFTNITLASAGATSSAAPRPVAGQAMMAPSAPKMTLAELATLYGECVSYAMVTLGAKCEEAGLTIDAAAIQSAAATLFIKATR